MKLKHHYPDEIVAKLKQAEAHEKAGASLRGAARMVGVSEETLRLWRTRFKDMDADQIAYMKELERQNARLRSALFELEGAPTPTWQKTAIR